MQGNRKYLEDDGQLRLKPGEYGKHSDGTWYARAPIGHMGNLGQHEVTENEDGTITVTPSILINDGETQWHGYLTNGVWNEC